MFGRSKSRSAPGSRATSGSRSRASSPIHEHINNDGDGQSYHSPDWEGQEPPPRFDHDNYESENVYEVPPEFRHDKLCSQLAKIMNGLNKTFYKLNLNNMEMFDIDRICSELQRDKKYDKKEIQNEMSSILSDKLNHVKQEIIAEDLAFHEINPRIPYPKYFAPGPALRDSQKRSEIAKFLPNGRNKFSGTESGPTIIEFLSNLNEIQDTFRLSEPEFQKYLKLSCTKEPYLVVANDIESGCSTSIIYNRLLMLYNKEQSPQDAKKELLNYKAQRIHDFSKVSGDILRLATHASSIIPLIQGDSREHLKNTEANHMLINCMPPQSKILLDQLYNNLFNRKRSPPSFHDFVQIILPNRGIIDDDIRKNGAPPTTNHKPYDNKYDRNKTYKVYNIRSFNPSNARNRPNFNQSDNRRPNVRRPDTRHLNKGNYNPNQVRSIPNRFLNDRACTLCGKSNHSAVQGCYAMRNNQNKVINVVPVQKECASCAYNKGIKLYHPAPFCPERQELQKFKRKSGRSQ